MLLEKFGPGAVQVDLFAGAFVDNFKAVAGQDGNAPRVLRRFLGSKGCGTVGGVARHIQAVNFGVGQHVGDRIGF